jgi:GxxExxY protein
LLRELELRGLSAVSQQLVKIEYKGLVFEEVLKFDVLVESCLLVEVKAVETVHPIHKAKLMSYMKLMDVPIRFVSGFIGSSSRIRYRSPFLFDLLCDLSDLLFPSCLRPERHGDADPVASNSWVIQPLRFRMYERFTDDARRVMQAAI